MSYARISVPPVVLALGALVTLGSLFACATGDESFGLGSLAPVGTQSQGEDGGTLLEAGAADDVLSLPDPTSPTPSDDAAIAMSDDAGSMSDDATTPPPPPVDAAPPPPVDSGTTTTCPGYAPPSTPAGCDCDPTKHACTANGCYGGYYCKLSTLACETKPSGC